MSIKSVVFTGKGEAQRLAQATASKIEIENNWKAEKRKFQETWPRKGHKLIFLVQEVHQSIGAEEATDIITEIDLLGKRDPVDLILHTHGGSAIDSDRIAEALVGRPRTTAFVPFYAMSGGTEIALSTQEIVLGKGAGLSPCDIHIDGWPARDIIELAKKRGDKADDDLVLRAKTAERVLKDEAEKLCALINRRHKGWFGLRGCSLARELVSGEMFHGEMIRYKQARHLGVNLSRRLPKILYEFISMRREQLRRLRELEQQITLVQQKMAENASDLAST